MIKKPFKVNDIVRATVDNTISYVFSTARLTKSSLFLLPMLGGTRRLFMFDKLFVNAFIAAEQYTNCIALLYRFSGDTIFLKFENDRVRGASFRTDGCGSSTACGSFAAEMSIEKNPDELLEITGEAILKKVGGLPEEEKHCAFLSAEALQESLNDYMIKQMRKKT